MTKQKNTKRALLASGLALFMCISMFVGSTFAWFTDSVKTGVNTIQAGTLDIVLEYKDANGEWQDAEGKTLSFKAADGRENILWEPGCTYELPAIRVRNNGNLALTYDIFINGITGDAKLLEAIEFTANDAAISAFSGNLNAKDDSSAPIVIKGHMKETAGNEYQGLSIEGIGITVYATQYTYEKDSISDQYDMGAAIRVDSAVEAQAALDNAKNGDVIILAPGNYGTLVFGRNASNKVVDISAIGGDETGNERYSRYENITILGAAGATVDQITFDNGREDANTIWNYIDVKNLTIKNVTFSGASTAVKIPDGFAIAIDGLSLVNCKMTDTEGNDRFVYQPHSGYKALNDKTTGEYVMTSGVKNLTITGCEITGAHQVIEARPMENITITDNTFKGIKKRDILLSGSDVLYTGTITITGNTSINGEERFVRGAGIGDATLIIKDNTINGYLGEDDDYIKVEGATGSVTIENNPMTRGAVNADGLAKALAQGGTVVLMNDIVVDVANTAFTVDKNTSAKIDLNGYDIIATGTSAEGVQLFSVNGNLDIVGNGTISLKNDNFAWNSSYRYTTINIREAGVVTLGEGVNVICETGAATAGGYGMNYAVDIYTTGTLNVNGASLHSNYIAVRCFYGNSVVNVNSGSITSSKNNWGIWPQSAPGAIITVANGISYTTDSYGIYIFD